MTKPVKIILITIASVAVIFGMINFWVSEQYKARELSELISSFGWRDYVPYSMLSKELKGIISEEEFSADSDEARLEMYRKLENLVLDDRESRDFMGSSGNWKSPYFEMYEIDGTNYFITFQLDIDYNYLKGKLEIINFICYINVYPK